MGDEAGSERSSLLGWLGAAGLLAYVITVLSVAAFSGAVEPAFAAYGVERAYAAATVGLLAVASVRALIAMRRRWVRRLSGLLVVIAGAAVLAIVLTDVDVATSGRRYFSASLYGLFAVTLLGQGLPRVGSAVGYPSAGAAVVLLAMADETARWWTRNGVGSAGLLAPLAGGVLGLAMAWLVVLEGRPRLALVSRGRATLLRIGALLTVGGAAYVNCVHLGHAIVVPTANATVSSRYALEQLSTLASEWRPRDQLTAVETLREGADFFADEAAWHLRQRDLYLELGDPIAALQSQRVLEVLYAPTLSALQADAELDPRVQALTAVEPELFRWPRALGPEHVVTRIDALTLWLAAIVLASGLLLVAEVAGAWRSM